MEMVDWKLAFLKAEKSRENLRGTVSCCTKSEYSLQVESRSRSENLQLVVTTNVKWITPASRILGLKILGISTPIGFSNRRSPLCSGKSETTNKFASAKTKARKDFRVHKIRRSRKNWKPMLVTFTAAVITFKSKLTRNPSWLEN